MTAILTGAVAVASYTIIILLAIGVVSTAIQREKGKRWVDGFSGQTIMCGLCLGNATASVQMVDG